jgi:hypothetical protein
MIIFVPSDLTVDKYKELRLITDTANVVWVKCIADFVSFWFDKLYAPGRCCI